jgi:hypothetical protein
MLTKHNTEFILAIDQEDLRYVSTPPIRGVVYSPSSFCSSCHTPGSARLIVEKWEGWHYLMCERCITSQWSVEVWPWIHAAESLDGLLLALYPKQIDLVLAGISQIARALWWSTYAVPNVQTLDLLLCLANEGYLSAVQIDTAQRLFSEQGGMAAIRRRRDIHYRIKRLRRLTVLRTDESRRLDKLAASNLDFERQPAGLTTAEADKIMLLEKRYGDELERLDQQWLENLIARSQQSLAADRSS